jgi:flagellar export protein FliJ
VKKFKFPLERLLELRRLQEEMERARLMRLAAGIRQVEERRSELGRLEERAAGDVRRSLTAGYEPPVGPLSALAGFRERIRRLDRRMEAQRAELEQQAAGCRAELLEASRRTQVLETCREKAFAEWRSAVDHEMENLAGELHLAKWKPRRR